MPCSARRRGALASACAGLLLAGSAALGGTASAAGSASGPGPAQLDLSAVRVSLSAPVQVERGRPAHLGAVVSSPATGDRVGGVTVILYGRPADRGAWTEAGRGVTDPRGVVVFRTAPRATTDYAAESLPTAGYAGGLSGVVRVKVRR